MNPDRLRRALCLGGFVVLSLLVFRAAFPAGQTIQSSDFNFSNLAVYKQIFPQDLFHGSWTSANLLGIQGMRSLNLTNLLIVPLPLQVFTDWIYPFYLTVASFLLALFLRRRGLDWSSSFIGAVVAFWTGSNLTLVYAGHLYKYGVLAFGSAALLCLDIAICTRKVSWALLAGGSVGMMFLEQQDLAVFYGVLLAGYAVFAFCRERSGTSAADAAKLSAKLALPAIALAGVMMVDPYLRAKTGVIDTATITYADPQAKWDWATQWSWPPEETVDFIAPGYMGLRAGDPDAPYWGRMGRSAGWETTRQGFGNFKLESQYIGILPVFLMTFALIAARRMRGTAGLPRGEILFWSGAVLVLFLLSCGKYLPFYKAFYHLPLMSSIRNPNKFLQVLQVAMGILTAFGFDALFKSLRERLGDRLGRADLRTTLIVCGGLCTLVLLALIGAASSGGADGDVTALGLGPLAEKIRGQKIRALLHALAFGAVGLGAFWMTLSRKSPTNLLQSRLGAVLIFLTALDVVLLASPYIVAKDVGSTINNPVASWLARENGPARVHAIDQSGIYGYIIANDFPYHGVNYANLLAAPRLPQEYESFLKATASNLPRFWDLFGVRYVLVAVPMWQRLQQMPGMKELLKPVLGWNLAPKGPDGVEIAVAQAGQPAQHLVLEIQKASGRAVFVPAWRTATDEQVLAALADPASDVKGVQWVSSETADGLPASPAPTGPPIAGQVRKEANDLWVTVETPSAGILRLADKFSTSLRVEVDGKPARLLRCQYLFPAVFLDAPGRHEVRFWYEPNRTGSRLVMAGLSVWLLGGIWVLVSDRKTRTS